MSDIGFVKDELKEFDEELDEHESNAGELGFKKEAIFNERIF